MTEGEGLRSWLYVVVFSFVFFNVLNKFIFQLFPPPAKFRNQRRRIWQWGNIATSWVHSVIMAFLSVYCLCKTPFMLEDMINAWNTPAYYTLAFSVGYFTYDFVSIMRNNRAKSLCISIHHTIVVTAFLIVMFTLKYIPFGLVALLMEVNSVFLHLRRLMRMSDVNPASMLFKINSILLTITFVIFRLVTCGWMLNFLVSHRHAISTLHFIFGTVGMCVLTPQNIFLLKQIWQSDSKSSGENQKEKVKEAEKELSPNSLTKLKKVLQFIVSDSVE